MNAVQHIQNIVDQKRAKALGSLRQFLDALDALDQKTRDEYTADEITTHLEELGEVIFGRSVPLL